MENKTIKKNNFFLQFFFFVELIMIFFFKKKGAEFYKLRAIEFGKKKWMGNKKTGENLELLIKRFDNIAFWV